MGSERFPDFGARPLLDTIESTIENENYPNKLGQGILIFRARRLIDHVIYMLNEHILLLTNSGL